MELAAAGRRAGRLTLAAITHVYTLAHVAGMLGEDEDWLRELTGDIFPEDGCLWIVGIGEDGLTGLTDFGIENPQDAIREARR